MAFPDVVVVVGDVVSDVVGVGDVVSDVVVGVGDSVPGFISGRAQPPGRLGSGGAKF